jgi:N-acetylglutamate synthase/N-acetylornithine aminotransferase
MAVANSSLVKGAVYGNHPNVGSVVAAEGSDLDMQLSLKEH